MGKLDKSSLPRSADQQADIVRIFSPTLGSSQVSEVTEVDVHRRFGKHLQFIPKVKSAAGVGLARKDRKIALTRKVLCQTLEQREGLGA
jgi:hypothetical protein